MAIGDYKINGVSIQDPTSGEWTTRRELGVTGAGRAVYPGLREFRLQWNLMALSDFDAVRDEWVKDQITGTAVVRLPDILQSTYAFREFSGCHLEEPQVGAYYQEYVTDVVLVVTNIRV